MHPDPPTYTCTTNLTTPNLMATALNKYPDMNLLSTSIVNSKTCPTVQCKQAKYNL